MMSDFDVCKCGDYRHQHGPTGGRCRVCGYGSAPYDGCGRFRLFKADETTGDDPGRPVPHHGSGP